KLPGGTGPSVTRHPGDSAPDLEAPRLAQGTEVGRYRVVRFIGGGGGGQVYEAYDPQLARAVALKLIRGDRAAHPNLVGEARALARLSHPNVVNVYDAGMHDGRAFVVMELVEGVTLDRWLEEPRTWREVAHRFMNAGQGLAAAHAAGLVHRDV